MHQTSPLGLHRRPFNSANDPRSPVTPAVSNRNPPIFNTLLDRSLGRWSGHSHPAAVPDDFSDLHTMYVPNRHDGILSPVALAGTDVFLDALYGPPAPQSV